MSVEKTANQPHDDEIKDLRNLSSSHRNQKRCDTQGNLNKHKIHQVYKQGPYSNPRINS